MSKIKVAFLGDSITEGVGASSKEYCYVEQFKKLSGARTYNYGISGTRIARQQNKTADSPSKDKYFASRIKNMKSNYDYIFVFGGTNDFGHGDAPFGEYGDRTRNTFCGAVYYLYDKLKNKFPKSKIFVITPMHRQSEDVLTNEIGIPCKPLKEYVKIIIKTAKEFGFPVVDYWNDCEKQTKPNGANEFFIDGLHPTDLGHKLIAEKLYKFYELNR